MTDNRNQYTDQKDVIANANGRWIEILETLSPALSKAIDNVGIHVPCPIHGGTDGFRLFPDFEETGGGICNTCGPFPNGIKLLREVNSWTEDQAVIEVDNYLNDLGISFKEIPRAKKTKKVIRKSQNRKKAIELWCESEEYLHEVGRYLNSRGIGEVIDDDLPSIRGYKNLSYFNNKGNQVGDYPAMLSKVVDENGRFVTVHRTYLDGKGKKAPVESPKKLMSSEFPGASTGCCIRFGHPDKTILLAEGIETSLACFLATGIPTWSTINANGMKYAKIPDDIDFVFIMADKDKTKTGIKAANFLAGRLLKEGRTVKIIQPGIPIPKGEKGIDFLDVFNIKGKNKISKLIESAEAQEPLLIAALNRQYTHTLLGSKHVVFSVTENSNRKKNPIFEKLAEFKNRFLHIPQIPISEKSSLPVGEWWLRHADKSYKPNGVGFYPNHFSCPNDVQNLYFGHSTIPMDGNITVYLNHVREVICDNDDISYRYLLGWMAHLIQKPEEKPGVAIVLKGGQGTGKGFFVKPLGEINANHYSYVSEGEHITGKFNSQISTSILIFADEALFAGSPKAANKLKSLITEEFQCIENKGQDPVMLQNYSRIIMASNNDWVINAGIDERRYLVLEVSNKYKQDQEYFEKLSSWVDRGGAAILHSFLLDYDLKYFNPRKAPKTKALLTQKLDSLNPAEKFWFNVLQDGQIEENVSWPKDIKTIDMKKEYLNFIKVSSVTRSNETVLGKMLKGMGVTKSKKTFSNYQTQMYNLPPLPEARELFEKYMGGTSIDW